MFWRKFSETKIIITVDNGIVAYDAVSYAKTKGIDVMITDSSCEGRKISGSILYFTIQQALCGAANSLGCCKLAGI